MIWNTLKQTFQLYILATLLKKMTKMVEERIRKGVQLHLF